ncbi:DUF1048 domain-containing protein [Microbacterium sp. No. 7]|uniref:DUF1048 domain-containing protein n=1 Tax=Microbacterium sp. No. 7 TaxID=1714373 RepID=UPI0006D1CE5C|nr:DUF1048 domain-containing protein [Microbacterium sp. No. 7]ALJ18620.1 hypothetical protein AOA12_01305 [Microbacterium sp. No. 7]
MNLIEKVVGDFGDKRRWREYKARVKALPHGYRTTVEALERYLLHFGATDGDIWLSAFDDLADLFERAAADGTPIREIVGSDPADFAETFAANYGGAGWINKERQRLADAVSRAEQREQSEQHDRSDGGDRS